MGFGMGSLWVEKGHQVCFSYSRSLAKLEATVAAAGNNASLCTPTEAAQFGQVVLLAIHWPQVPQVVGEIQPHLAGKPLLTCVVPWNPNHNGLGVGTDSSAAEEIARLAPEAHVVEALPLLADGLYAPSRLFGPERATLFYCGNDTPAKETVALLLEELDMQPLDAGDLTSARYLEPTAALLWHLAIGKGEGTDIALKLLRR
jgi:predicted dinucleotide-binding enzyme